MKGDAAERGGRRFPTHRCDLSRFRHSTGLRGTRGLCGLRPNKCPGYPPTHSANSTIGSCLTKQFDNDCRTSLGTRYVISTAISTVSIENYHADLN